MRIRLSALLILAILGSSCPVQGQESGQQPVDAKAPRKKFPITRDKEGRILPQAYYYTKGVPYWVATNNVLDVLVASTEQGGYLSIAVAVTNYGQQPVTVDPAFVVVEDRVGNKLLRSFSAEQVARNPGGPGAWDRFRSGFAQGLRDHQDSTSTFDARSSTGETVTGTVTAPPSPEQRQRRANEEGGLLQSALRTESVFQNQTVSGFLYFERPKVASLKRILGREYKGHEKTKSFMVFVIIPVGEDKFQFIFPVKLTELPK